MVAWQGVPGGGEPDPESNPSPSWLTQVGGGNHTECQCGFNHRLLVISGSPGTPSHTPTCAPLSSGVMRRLATVLQAASFDQVERCDFTTESITAAADCERFDVSRFGVSIRSASSLHDDSRHLRRPARASARLGLLLPAVPAVGIYRPDTTGRRWPRR